MRAGIRRLFRLPLGRRGVERAVDDELRFHLEMRVEELMRGGISRERAVEQAAREFGDVGEAHRELAAIGRRREGRDARSEWWRAARQDALVALRTYRRHPGFAVVVILTLAIGIAANTAIFSIVNAVLLRPLPYTRPEQLVHLYETHRGDVSSISEASYPDFVDWRGEHSLFSALEGYDETNVTVSDASGGEMASGARVTSGFFRMLGVSALRGRTFSAEDDVPGGTPAVVLSHGFWIRRFAADPDIAGRSVTIDGRPYEIRGVLPPQFSFAPAGDAALWLPIGRNDTVRAQRFNHWVRPVARLREGITVDAARRRMGDVMRQLESQYPETNSGRGALVLPLSDVIRADLRRPLFVLLGAVAIVMLIACANVASLVLTRSLERGREIAVRAALGASRRRIVRQLLTENLVLAMAGAILGAWLAAGAVRLLVAAIPQPMLEQMPSIREATVDLTALGFTIVVAIGTGLVFGLVPALLASRSSTELLRSDSRVGAGRTRHRLRDALVMAEIALTLVLMVAATLMGRSLFALLRVNPGFSAEHVATVRVALAGPSYVDGARQNRFFEDAVAAVRGLPGVETVGAISNPPLQGGGTNTFRVDGAPPPSAAARPEATTRAVAGDYFRALRIPVVEGRVLTSHDDLTAAYAVVINESLARRLFGARGAVGQRLRFYAWQDSAWTIVGVVGDVKTDGLDEPASPTVYYSHLQGPANRMSILARGEVADPSALVPAMRREINRMDPAVAVYAAGTMADRIARSQAVYSRRYLLLLLGAFAVAALLLAIIGVYGVIAYSVTQRTREIAIRIALGARQSEVLSLVLRNGLRLVGVGVVVGTVAALGLSRTLSSLLFGVSAGDRWTYGLVSLLLVVVAVLASYAPARRATRFDPAMTLRSE